MYNNLWQLIMRLREEEQRKREQAARNLGNGTHDGGMSLQEMFRRFRPTLTDAWLNEDGHRLPYRTPQQPKQDTPLIFGPIPETLWPQENLKFQRERMHPQVMDWTL